ncbi:MAG: hypothetical protein IJS12_10560 [Lachnospiraceae bacterium]|nr:hypothetical protein [Lachnospiraceae bacterium]
MSLSVRAGIKKIVSGVGIDPAQLKGRLNGLFHRNAAFNVYHTRFERNAIVAYIVKPFKDPDWVSNHQGAVQIMELARILSERGYNVDVIDYLDPYVRLPRHKSYDLVIAQFPKDCDRYTLHLKPDAVRIAYITTSSTEFNNKAELGRIEALYERKGARLEPYRQIPPITDDIRGYKASLVMGNHRNIGTYDYLPNPYIINNSSKPVDFEVTYDEKSPLNFMYLGSVGQVHKGLDLLLEIFSEPGFPCNLYVCGAYEHEADFFELYARELHRDEAPDEEYCSNIYPMGVVDTSGDIYRDVASKCAYLISPSCAEGKSGSVLTAMMSGIVPIISKESGFDADESILLDDCSIECIRSTILEYSHRDMDWIRETGEHYRQIALSKYTLQGYIDSVNVALDDILNSKQG